jgi:hypothetical protein
MDLCPSAPAVVVPVKCVYAFGITRTNHPTGRPDVKNEEPKQACLDCDLVSRDCCHSSGRVLEHADFRAGELESRYSIPGIFDILLFGMVHWTPAGDDESTGGMYFDYTDKRRLLLLESVVNLAVFVQKWPKIQHFS